MVISCFPTSGPRRTWSPHTQSLGGVYPIFMWSNWELGPKARIHHSVSMSKMTQKVRVPASQVLIGLSLMAVQPCFTPMASASGHLLRQRQRTHTMARVEDVSFSRLTQTSFTDRSFGSGTGYIILGIPLRAENCGQYRFGVPGDLMHPENLACHLSAAFRRLHQRRKPWQYETH